MTITENEAFDAMREHHRMLDEHVGVRIAALVRAVDSRVPHEPAVAALVAYMAEEVLPHMVAEEETVYRAASERVDLGDRVIEMTAEHRSLISAVEQLATAPSGAISRELASGLGTVFTLHVNKENELLGALLDDDRVELAQLLAEMHRRTEATHGAEIVEDPPALDSEAIVLSLLLEAATDLARVDEGDRACKLVASAWVALRVSRPVLATRTTASLHRLVRSTSSEPITLRVPVDDNHESGDRDLDVRHLAPAQRHERIFAEYHGLANDGSYVLVNDHDPKPLRYQFEAEYAGQFTWDAIESGPEVWRVRIGKPSPEKSLNGNVSASATSGDHELDVRILPHGQRHDVIFAAYDQLVPGGQFVLVNDHDPRPLRYQFEAEHTGEFTWDYVESGPDAWRVRIGKHRVTEVA